MGLGPPEMAILLVIVLVLFGARKLPELARAVGQSVTELRRTAAEVEGEGGPEPDA